MTPWTSREDWLALKFPAEQVAKITGRSLVDVVLRQDQLRNAPVLAKGPQRAPRWTTAELAQIHSSPTIEAVRLTGRTRRAVYRRRQLLRQQKTAGLQAPAATS